MIIQSDAGTFGPFLLVERLDDRLRADGVDFPFDVLGTFQILDQAMPVPEPSPDEVREEFKRRRAAAVAAIIVTVDSMSFDGDETSQDRMARAIMAMNAAGVDSTTWVLSTNAAVSVSVGQLRQALILAGTEQSRLWVQP